MALAEAHLKPGEIVAGRYRIEDVLGSGGMGVVYSATHLGLSQRVALKMLLPSAILDDGVVARFLREAQITGQLTSEHVVRVTDVGQDSEGVPFLVMEHLSGSNLAEILRSRGPLPVADAIGWILEACEGVAEAHKLGIVHRDIKPANLFLARRANGTSVVKVLDFGISKLLPSGLLAPDENSLTASASMMGSPRYMSPEQVRSAKHVDLRSDIWSLGVTLYELISGALPFSGDSSFELLVSIVSSPPAPLGSLRPDVPPALEQVILRCLEKEPARRFAHVGELAEALVPFGSGTYAALLPRILAFSSAAAPGAALSSPDIGLSPTEAATPSPRGFSTTGPSTSQPPAQAPSVPAASPARSAMLVAAGALLALGAGRWLAGPSQAVPATPSATSTPPSAALVSPSAAPSAMASSEQIPPASSASPPSSVAPPSSASGAPSASPGLRATPRPPKSPGPPGKSTIRDEPRK